MPQKPAGAVHEMPVLVHQMSTESKPFLNDLQRQALDAALAAKLSKLSTSEPDKVSLTRKASRRMSVDGREAPALSKSEVTQDKKSRNGRNYRSSKKDGAGGKYTWGAVMDSGASGPALDPRDPNYDSGDDGSPVQYSLESAASGQPPLDSLAGFKRLVAKVYISIFSDPVGKETAMAELARLQPYVRKKIGSSMSLRLTPEIRFIYDESHDRGERVLKLLKQIKMQETGQVEAPPIAVPARQLNSGVADAAEGDSESDSDEEEGFFDDKDSNRTSSPSSKKDQAARASKFSQRPEADTSFFGFQDPGNTWNDDLEELAWRKEEEVQPNSDIDSWTGGSRAEGASEAVESSIPAKESKASRRRK